MIKLDDGPCKGAYALGRAPVYLRATIDAQGKADCLDQLTDTPAEGERVHVYRQTEYRGPVIIHMARPRRAIWTHSADYTYLSDVDGEQLRETDAWRAWCNARAEADRAIGIPA